MLYLQDQEEGKRQGTKDKKLTAEKRKQCDGDGDVGVIRGHEDESSSKKTHVDDYFVKKQTAATAATSRTVKEVDNAGNVEHFYVVLMQICRR